MILVFCDLRKNLVECLRPKMARPSFVDLLKPINTVKCTTFNISKLTNMILILFTALLLISWRSSSQQKFKVLIFCIFRDL